MSHGVLFDWVDRLSKPGRLITYLMVGGKTITQVNNITLANTITLGVTEKKDWGMATVSF